MTRKPRGKRLGQDGSEEDRRAVRDRLVRVLGELVPGLGEMNARTADRALNDR